jgi:hypothetical protein
MGVAAMAEHIIKIFKEKGVEVFYCKFLASKIFYRRISLPRGFHTNVFVLDLFYKGLLGDPMVNFICKRFRIPSTCLL